MDLRQLIYSKDLSDEMKFRLLSILDHDNYVEELIDIIAEHEDEIIKSNDEIYKLKMEIDELQDKFGHIEDIINN
jgi:peptidoglycan hydrolase CwlO-like protein